VPVTSFGEIPEPLTPDSQGLYFRAFGLGADGRIWVGSINRWSVEQWDGPGRLARTFVRSVPWFPSWGVPVTPAEEAAPRPSIRDLREDANRRVWIAFAVPDAGWRSGMRPRPEMAVALLDPEARFDAVVEVLDPRRGVCWQRTVMVGRHSDSSVMSWRIVTGERQAARPGWNWCGTSSWVCHGLVETPLHTAGNDYAGGSRHCLLRSHRGRAVGEAAAAPGVYGP
jgi:hypothetical protein